jgi:molybdopterin synthase sulfur carrier subunit
MITVLFFAKYREQLGTRKLELDFTADCVGALKKQLALSGGQIWQEILFNENTLCAVNQTIVEDQQSLSDGDEVAFYPPVTGG